MLYALLPLIQRDLSLTDTQAGSLASAFMLVYMVAAPPVAYWADRRGRTFWIALGIALWSVATALSGLARSFTQLFAARATVGIGESCYGAVSPSFVAEHYPAERRARVLALFSMAIPVGSALGYVAGGALGEAMGWRAAFFVLGAPGLVLAALCARLPEPQGASEARAKHPVPEPSTYMRLFKVRSFMYVTLAGAAMTFGLGGMAVWMPTFFHREFGLSVAKAGTLFGAATVVGGLIGSLAGGWLADRALARTSKAYFLVSGLGLALGMPFALLALQARSLEAALAALVVAETLLFLNMGPLNAVIVAVTPLPERSMAFAANIFVIHALGDAVSPTIIGALSDRFGLRPALGVACAALGVAGALCFAGMRRYDEDARHS